jgi:serine/threonine protein kinase
VKNVPGFYISPHFLPAKTPVWSALVPSSQLKIIKQLANGIDEIHTKGFVHGEIKPGNICIRTKDYHTILGGYVISNVPGSSFSDRCAVIYRCPMDQTYKLCRRQLLLHNLLSSDEKQQFTASDVIKYLS